MGKGGGGGVSTRENPAGGGGSGVKARGTAGGGGGVEMERALDGGGVESDLALDGGGGGVGTLREVEGGGGSGVGTFRVYIGDAGGVVLRRGAVLEGGVVVGGGSVGPRGVGRGNGDWRAGGGGGVATGLALPGAASFAGGLASPEVGPGGISEKDRREEARPDMGGVDPPGGPFGLVTNSTVAKKEPRFHPPTTPGALQARSERRKQSSVGIESTVLSEALPPTHRLRRRCGSP